MKTKIKRIIIIIMILLNCGIIFGFSCQNGEKSGGLSGKLTRDILSKIKFIERSNEKEAIIARAGKVIRKIAHFSIYSLLGLLLMSFLYTYSLQEIYMVSYTLLIGVLYAILDEFHQYFVSGRSAQVTDVMLDSMGVIFGILLVMLFKKIQNVTKNCKKTCKKKV